MRDGFINARAALGTGVYVLRNAGRVVWVGKAKRVAVKLAGHLSGRGGPAASIFHPVEFDDVDIRPCRVDQLEAVWCEVCVEVGWQQGPPAVLAAAQSVIAKLERRV